MWLGSKFSPSLSENVGLRVPAWYRGDFALLNVCSSLQTAHELLMLAGTLMDLVPKAFSFIIFKIVLASY
jgi:hypothetical protein